MTSLTVRASYITKEKFSAMWENILNRKTVTPCREGWLEAQETRRQSRPKTVSTSHILPTHLNPTPPLKGVCHLLLIWLNNISEWRPTLEVPGHPHASTLPPGWQNISRTGTVHNNTGLWAQRHFYKGLLRMGFSSLPPWLIINSNAQQSKAWHDNIDPYRPHERTSTQ